MTAQLRDLLDHNPDYKAKYLLMTPEERQQVEDRLEYWTWVDTYRAQVALMELTAEMEENDDAGDF